MKSYYLGYTPKADQRAERARQDTAFMERRVRDLPTMIANTEAKLADLKEEARLIGLSELAQ